MTTSLRTLLAAVALLTAVPATADEVAEARARFEQGASLFRAGKYREAIAAFEAAYRVKPHGAIHFNVAQCREKLGEWPAALRSYQDYLRELPEARDRAAVRAAIGRLEQRLAGAGVQALLVYTDPPGAAVRLDGKARGRTPFHITLPPGGYRLALSLDGFAAEEQEVEVSLGASRVVEVVLRAGATPTSTSSGSTIAAHPEPFDSAALARGSAQDKLRAEGPESRGTPTPTATPTPASSMTSGVPMSAPAPAPTPPPDLTPHPPPAPPSIAIPPPPPPPVPAPSEPSGWTVRRIAAWTTSVGALAAAGAAVTFGAQARSLSSQLRDGTVRTSADADSLARRSKSNARTANILYGVSGAAAAAGVTLFVLEGRF